MHRIVTGIKPSGRPHLGNYFGMIEPALRLADHHEAIYFVADLHALTTVRDPDELRSRSIEVAATWIALGLDPSRSTLYLQSDIPEVTELTWLLACVTAKGLLNRGHAYKSVADINRAAARPVDDGVNAGLFNYPLLMAADILMHRADVVPVGEDNRQHVEICRDVAGVFNATFGDVLTVPDVQVEDDVATIVGTDGRKMGKSYGNVVPMFGTGDDVARSIMSVVTDSRRPEEPKDPDSCNVFGLFRLLAQPEAVDDVADRYRAGSIGYREAKELAIDAHRRRFGGAQARFDELMACPNDVRALLVDGAERARDVCRSVVADARRAVGLPA